MSDDAAAKRPGYIYVEMNIRDPERFRQYTTLSAPAVKAAGGRYIVTGARPECLEGGLDADRVVVVQFDSAAQARDFYHSAAYQAARAKRLGAAEFPHAAARRRGLAAARARGQGNIIQRPPPTSATPTALATAAPCGTTFSASM